MLTACSVTPSPGKLRQSPGRVGKKKKKNVCAKAVITAGITVLLIFILADPPCLQGRVSGKSSQLGVLRGEELHEEMLPRDFSNLLAGGAASSSPCPPRGHMLKGSKNLRKRVDVGGESALAAFLAFSLGPHTVQSITRALQEGDIARAWSPPRKKGFALEVGWQPCSSFQVAKGFLFVYLDDFLGARFSNVSFSSSPWGIAQHAGLLQLRGELGEEKPALQMVRNGLLWL